MRNLNDSANASPRGSLPAASTHTCHTRQIFAIAGVPALLFAAMLLAIAGSTAKATEEVSAHKHDAHQHSNVFPPQRSNISNVIWLNPKDSGGVGQRESDGASAGSHPVIEASRITADPQVKQALGERFVFVGSTVQREKNSASGTTSHSFFSHSKNATVEVTMEGSSIGRIDTIKPESYQPPLAAAEVNEAIELARAALLKARYTASDALSGYAILAFPPNSSIPFYDHRLAYVSFHAHEDVQPEFTALVDLTQQRVLTMKED